MIDLHTHLLPGIDDGPAELEGTVALARAAAEQGTRVMAATPHLRSDHAGVHPAELAERAQAVRAALAEEAIELEVVQGGEVALTWATGATDEELRLVSYGGGGSDVLLETPFSPLSNTFELTVESVEDRGYRVLLGHPENNPTFQDDPGRLAALARRGVLVQVTARSLVAGRRRSAASRLARALVADGMAHVIASDAHSAGPFRPPQLAEGLGEAAALVGRARARWMVDDAPAAILAGQPLPAPPPAELLPVRRRRRFSLRRGAT